MHTRSNRFRTKDDLIPLMLYPYFVLSEGSRESIESMVRGFNDGLVYVPKREITDRYAQVAVGREDDNWAGKLDKILQVKPQDRKSTRLNSSHVAISYAVFCLKKKK